MSQALPMANDVVIVYCNESIASPIVGGDTGGDTGRAHIQSNNYKPKRLIAKIGPVRLSIPLYQNGLVSW